MCGIAGIISLSPQHAVNPDDLRLMAAHLVHRGPDDAGFYTDPRARCGLGFRRLSIIDLACGNQPLCNEDRTIWLIFNGEIYNFRELRRDLEQRGHRFSTQGDAETIVHLYEEHGPECFARLSGMFAIALWDERAGVLHLARDRLGKKPLVLAEHAGRLYFASEAKAILAIPGMPRDIDPQSLHRYLVFQYVPAPHSIFRGFEKLLPGHRVAIKAGAPERKQIAYWTPPHPSAGGASSHRHMDEAIERLDELLTSAVRKRLIADVPLGAFLSGGIDSSIVVGLMRRLGVSPLRTFSIGFADARYDESRHARRVAEHFQTEHHEHVVTPRAAEILPQLAWHYDEPFADSSAIPTWYVSRFTRDSVTVALTGDGGDECFAGYDRYRAMQLAAWADRLPDALRRTAAAAVLRLPGGGAKSLPNRVRRFFEALAKPPAQRYLSWVSVFAPEQLTSSYAPAFAARLALDEPVEWLAALFNSGPGDAAARANYVDFRSYLPYDLLTKVDIASMACSLECRAPFLDHELVEFALGLPTHWKLGPSGGKLLLKRWAKRLLPREILYRGKMGFGVPIGEWFRADLQPLLRERILGSSALCGRFFRPGVVEQWVETHVSGRANHGHRLWALLMLELWAETWHPAGI